MSLYRTAPIFLGTMKDNYGYGPWEYRHVCKSCGHAVRAPKNKTPCSVCGGDFGQKMSMRKLYLEPEKPTELYEVEYTLPKAWLDSVREFFGFPVRPRIEIRKEKKKPARRWRWQTHTEVEEESGIIHHDEFLS